LEEKAKELRKIVFPTIKKKSREKKEKQYKKKRKN
jgi:hypothetical protein